MHKQRFASELLDDNGNANKILATALGFLIGSALWRLIEQIFVSKPPRRSD